MRKHTIFLLTLILSSTAINAQDTIPHIKGVINFSIKKGTIACDLTLSNMPRLSNYYIRLNAGMNIRNIMNAEGTSPLQYDRSIYDTLSSGESLAYFIPGYNKSGKYLPHAVRFQYTGMYPVITDTSGAADWRGNIAFNGTTLRADGIQSAWTPILYDVNTDTRYDKVTYDLDISCNDCKVIYMNGSQPVTGTRAKVKSNTSQDLTLFAGDFKSVSINGNYFLNPDADDQQLTALEKILASYQDYLSKKLSIPYKGKAVYVQTTPVSKKDSWLFASYPTIVKVGWDDGMKSFVSESEGAFFKKYMAHELSHYYFGTYRTFNANLGDMVSEGFSEYLALHITRTTMGDSIYLEQLKAKVYALRNLKPLPMASIVSKSDYQDRELYVYYYAPIIFSAIEKEIGMEKMWEWIKALLQSPMLFTDYTFVSQTLNKVVKDKTKYASIRQRYFQSDSSLQHAVSLLNIPVDEKNTAGSKGSEIKTYYYFVFSRPMIDAGVTQNRVVKHSEIAQATCTYEELMKIADPLFKKMGEECENDGGCTKDFNIYYTKEQAEEALKKWLARHNKNGNMVVKILKP
jgi:hypothetical protein